MVTAVVCPVRRVPSSPGLGKVAGKEGHQGVHTLRKRIFFGYGAILSLIVVILGGSMVCIMELGRASDALLQEDYQSILAAVT